jgi:magnesium-transporting ATPase (P-type)
MGKGGQERRQAAVAKFGVLADHGLSSEEATMRLQRYRPNELERHAPRSVWKLVLEQFEDTLVRILLPAAVVSFVLALYDDTEVREIGVRQCRVLSELPFSSRLHTAISREGLSCSSYEI